MKIVYREPTLIELINEAIATATAQQPIACIELNQQEFNSVFSYLDRSQSPVLDQSGEKRKYFYRGIPVKVADE